MTFIRGLGFQVLGQCYGWTWWSRHMPSIVLSRGCANYCGHNTIMCYVVWTWRGPRRRWLT